MNLANIISSLSLLLSVGLVVFRWLDRRHAKFSVENEYTRDLLSWHGEVIEVLVRLKLSLSKEARLPDLAHLSALIEQGRFFFPNIDRRDNHGEKKPPAYRGYRNLALDFLVATYGMYEKDGPSDRARAETLHRHFTSIVFEILRPEDRLRSIREITDRYFVQNKTFENFLKHRDAEVLFRMWRTRSTGNAQRQETRVIASS